MTETYGKLRDANAARQKAWDPDSKITPLFRAVELAGEAGEAGNKVKKLERERLGIPGSRATVEELAEELADTVIAADLLAMDYGIDLNAAIAKKFNATSEKMGFPQRIDRVVLDEPVKVIEHPDGSITKVYVTTTTATKGGSVLLPEAMSQLLKADNDGWIEWGGLGLPELRKGTIIDIRDRDGTVWTNVPYGSDYPAGKNVHWDWWKNIRRNRKESEDIVAYRITPKPIAAGIPTIHRAR